MRVRTGAKIYAENGGGPRRAAEKALLLGGFAALPSPSPAPQVILQANDPIGEVMMRKHEYFSAALSGSPPFSA